MKNISKYTLLILLILFLAAFLRLFKLSSVPPSLSWDEVSIGYDAWSIIKTGKDQWGESFPVAFKSFGEYKYPLHIYTTVLSLAVFGYGEFAVRAGSAILGVINILLLYLFVVEATKNKKLGLLSALFLAISPWHIQFSRVSWETNYALFFFYSGLLLFFKYINDYRRKQLLVLSFVLFSISLFTYNAAKIFIPLFLIILVGIYYKNLIINKSLLFLSLAIFIIFLALNVVNPKLSGAERYSQVKFKESQVVETVFYKTTRIYKLGWAETAVKQYLQHFSPKYLFVSGDPNPRHSTQSVGQLYWLDLIFIVLGFYALYKAKNRFSALLVAWFFLAILPASVVREVPHASRTMMALGCWQIVSAFGALMLLESKYFKKHSFLKFTLFLLIIVGAAYYLYNYFVLYPVKYSRHWQYGYKQLVEYINDNYNNYDSILINRVYGEPHIYILFYVQYAPERYQSNDSLTWHNEGSWIKVEQFDKYEFIDINEKGITYSEVADRGVNEKLLLVGTPGDIPEDVDRINSIYFLDGTTAFELVEL